MFLSAKRILLYKKDYVFIPETVEDPLYSFQTDLWTIRMFFEVKTRLHLKVAQYRDWVWNLKNSISTEVMNFYYK